MAKRRPNGEGMIRQKKKGLWEGRIVVGHKSDGKRVSKNVYAKTEEECEIKLAELIKVMKNKDAV